MKREKRKQKDYLSSCLQVDRQCLPKNKSSVLTSEDISIRRQQVRQKLAEFSLQQKSGEMFKVEESQETPKVVIEDAPIFVAFARVFSGTLRRGQELYVLGPKYDPSTMEDDIDSNLTLKVNPIFILENDGRRINIYIFLKI
jgi:ribosome assembly protein 1